MTKHGTARKLPYKYMLSLLENVERTTLCNTLMTPLLSTSNYPKPWGNEMTATFGQQ